MSGKDREVIFEVIGDLDNAWSSFDGATVQFTLTDVDEAEGEDSEKDYTDTGEYFAKEKRFERVEIKGNDVSFGISRKNVDGHEYVAGTEGVGLRNA